MSSTATATATATATFSPLSKHITNTLTKDEKKNGGIFFTPPSCIQQIMALLRDDVSLSTHTFDTILEPSCGSGEFLSVLMRQYPNAWITGVEIHPVIYAEVSTHFNSLVGGGRVSIQHGDFLKYSLPSSSAGVGPGPGPGPGPDLIIGNPPYFVMKKEEVDAEYYPFFDGRPNIFILFIIKSAQLLRAGGVLCFVLPSSFMNSHYYDKTRKYIVRHFAILHIVKCDGGGGGDEGYLDTQQGTFILILRKYGAGVESLASGTSGAGVFEYAGVESLASGTSGAGVFEYAGASIFTDNLPRLISLYAGSTSLHELGFEVSIGTVVWNQCKDILTNDATKPRLIYNSNIQEGRFEHKTYKNGEKKAFIDKPGIRTPMIVVNRGYGVGKYKFYYCLITPDAVSTSSSSAGYLIENHLICITHKSSTGTTDHAPSSLTAFHRVIKSFQDPRTQEFISYYCGNNAISSTELHLMLPIYGTL